ncbi:pyruvate decarboxylase [Auricularia subglabra TFB-10046 SS5]|nr:pyruvate decarboxylase [Auricularia subglabra TFB-10046 SS5]
MSAPNETVTVSNYILTRLLGVKSLFGVPGDFNLAFLDVVEDHPSVEWIGCCNELNAAYAADGYARVSSGLGVVVTTFGVGELSALNGIAGAFSERVPVLHLVGVPSTKLQAHHALLHHTLGDGRFNVYIECGAHVTIAQETLTGPHTAGEQIDRVIISALMTCRPTYLTLPTDLVEAEISAAPLARALTLERVREVQFAPAAGQIARAQEKALDAIVQLYKEAKKPVVLIDACAVRYGVIDLVRKLVKNTGMPYYTTPMAKASLDENDPKFGGIYVGNATIGITKENFEAADFILTIGLLMSDFNSGNFSFRLPEQNTVEVHSDHTKLAGQVYAGVTFFTLLPALVNSLHASGNKGQDELVEKQSIFSALKPDWQQGEIIEQEWFWAVFANFLKENDIVLSETGELSPFCTSNFGLIDVLFPRNTLMLSQVLWGSIGWSVGASLGAAVAARERNRRFIAFTGDGSVQVTVQDFSTMLRHGLTPIIVLLNNDGYTIERFINGPERAYNDIQPWRWSEILNAFGAKPGQANVHKVSTPKELHRLLQDPALGSGEKLTFIEVIMGKLDAPRLLKVQAELTHKANLA